MEVVTKQCRIKFMSSIKAHFDGTTVVFDEPLPFPLVVGQSLRVFVEPVIGNTGDAFTDLEAAAASSTDFWDNPFDDEDWNGK